MVNIRVGPFQWGIPPVVAISMQFNKGNIWKNDDKLMDSIGFSMIFPHCSDKSQQMPCSKHGFSADGHPGKT
jgi:hypothetical protein